MNFFNKVYEVVRSIPQGNVLSYGKVAVLCGNKNMARHVGFALHVNPDQKTIPCHRVVTKAGKTSVAFAFGGSDAQKMLLESEGVEFIDGLVNMEKCEWKV